MQLLMAQRKKGLEVKIRTVPKVSSVTEAVESNIPNEGEIYCTKEDPC
jgi:NAD(P)H dehydrogenase (quinone)